MSQKILVVDDEPGLRDLLAECLTGAGYSVTACADGREALEALGRANYDVVLSDISMPDMDGLALLGAIRESDLDLPVLLLTGTPSLETAIKAIEWGALEYLVKPAPLETILHSVERAAKLGNLAKMKREALIALGSDKLVGDRAGLHAALRRAIETHWMAYQPIVRADNGARYAHEALLRTTEPMLPNPGAFLRAAERLGVVADLGRVIRGTVAAALAADYLSADVFVNLHPLDLNDRALLDSGAPLSHFADRVVLEITERASLEGVKDLATTLAALRSVGYRIALDDLGAGYAGLTSLAALHPDVVKLDMALVQGLDSDPTKEKLVRGMTAVCRDMGITVVAEGIETAGEREAVVAAGCDLLQGFFIARPAPAGPKR